MSKYESRGNPFEYWRDKLASYLEAPYRWDTPPEDVLYSADESAVCICRNNLLMGLISAMELAQLRLGVRLSTTDATTIQDDIKVIKRIGIDRNFEKKTPQDMQEIRTATEQCLSVLQKY